MRRGLFRNPLVQLFWVTRPRIVTRCIVAWDTLRPARAAAAMAAYEQKLRS